MKKKKIPKGNTKISNFFVSKETNCDKANTYSDNFNKFNKQTTSQCSPKKRKLENNINFENFPSKRLLIEKTPEKYIKPSTSNRIKTPSNKSPKRQISLNKNLSPSTSKNSVNMLENFIKIISTPQKISPIKIDKKQASIEKYLSPIKSPKSVQKLNERTPTKGKSPNNNKQRNSKVKTKLNFFLDTTSSDDDTFVDINLSDFEDLDNKLNLNEYHRCIITNIIRNMDKISLKLKSLDNNQTNICIVQGFWLNIEIHIGDVVCVNAFKSSTTNEWTINNEKGILIYNPDLLLSCTSVVSTLFCKRRFVLGEIYPDFDSCNRYMLIGVLVHNLLQTVLKDKIKSKDIPKVFDKFLHSNSTAKRMYASDIKLCDIQKDLDNYVRQISEFNDNYVDCGKKIKKGSVQEKTNWQGKITDIVDIEETIWCPQLGIKGKIDVTIESGNRIYPLEVKTGRSSISLEHRGQVILYLMMMNKIGYKVTSGLLLYLKDGNIKEITNTTNEQRDILILRNELAYYLTRKIDQLPSENLSIIKLPPPINHPSCSKCPYNIMCTTYLKYEQHPISKTLADLQGKITGHLTDNHIKYFLHWTHLLTLEELNDFNNEKMKSSKDIYTLTPEQREIKGKTLINLTLIDTTSEDNELYLHKFQSTNMDRNFLSSGLNEGNYIIISLTNRPAIATGFIITITINIVTITIDKNLKNLFPNKLFHIDSYDSTKMQMYNLSCLSLLLDDTNKSNKLRQIIIDKKLPNYRTKLPTIVAKKGAGILKNLNCKQQKAILQALTMDDYFLIKGMPGCGKTATTVALIQLLNILNKTILITSHTHSAIDNICCKLIDLGLNVLRLGTESRFHEKLKNYSEHILTKSCKSPEEIEAIFNKFNIIAVTCLGSGHPLLSKREIDVCIVDESTQVLQTALIRPLYNSKTFILIGDPDQLSPVVKNKQAMDLGMSESLFERLSTSDSMTILNINYRMNRTITNLANKFTYEDRLEIGNETIANARLPINNDKLKLIKETWLKRIFNDSLENAVNIINTGPIWKEIKLNSQYYDHINMYHNNYECSIVNVLIENLIKLGINSNDIGVMATYTAQVAKISKILNKYNVEVNTVDQFQGRDKMVIIYSCTLSKDIQNNKISKDELLENKNRITVAITRAKCKLIIIGDLSTITNYTTMKKIIELIDNQYIIDLHHEKDFQWKSILLIDDN